MPSRTRNLYDMIQTNKRGQSSLQFPNDLETSGHGNIIRFNINVPEGSKYGGGGGGSPGINPSTGQQSATPVYRRSSSNSMAKRFSGNSIRTDTVIDLYMPPEVKTEYQSNWNTKSLGSAGGATEAFMNMSELSLSDLGDLAKEMGIKTLTRLGSAASPFDIDAMGSMATQTTANPYMEVLFESVENRKFNFTFKMIPRNFSEQETIQSIVKAFKLHQAPEVKFAGKSQYWLFPSEFDIKFMHREKENPWLFKISTCALTNFSVDYSPEGSYAAYAEGAPFATTINLQFLEMEVHTKETIDQGF